MSRYFHRILALVCPAPGDHSRQNMISKKSRRVLLLQQRAKEEGYGFLAMMANPSLTHQLYLCPGD